MSENYFRPCHSCMQYFHTEIANNHLCPSCSPPQKPPQDSLESPPQEDLIKPVQIHTPPVISQTQPVIQSPRPLIMNPFFERRQLSQINNPVQTIQPLPTIIPKPINKQKTTNQLQNKSNLIGFRCNPDLYNKIKSMDNQSAFIVKVLQDYFNKTTGDVKQEQHTHTTIP